MKTKDTKKFAIIGLLVVIGIVATIILVVRANANTKNLYEQLNLGNKYLYSLEYEQAVVAYEAAIQIDPKCVDAYLGLSKAYEYMGDPVKAAQVMVFAYAKVPGNDREKLEATFDDLVNNYAEVRDMVDQGLLELGSEVSEDEFNDFFHINEHNNTDSNNSGNDLDSSIDLNLAQFTLLGQPLGNWTFDSLESYIRTNFTASPELDQNNNLVSYDRCYDLYDGTTSYFAVIDYDQEYNGQKLDPSITVYVDEMRYSYTIRKRDETLPAKYWDIQSNYINAGNDSAANICGKPINEYLDSLCPGLYDKLQTQNSISSKNGYHAVKYDTDYEVFTPEGSIRLYTQDGNIISLIQVRFNDDWYTATSDSATSISNSNGSSEMNGNAFNWDIYTLFGQPLDSWTSASMTEYIKNHYTPLEGEGGAGDTYHIIVDGEIVGLISCLPNTNGDGNIRIGLLDGLYSIDITFMTNSVYYDFRQIGDGAVDLGAGEIMTMANYTPMEYLSQAQPNINATLNEDGSVTFSQGNGSNYSSIYLYTNPDTGRIDGVNFMFTK